MASLHIVSPNPNPKIDQTKLLTMEMFSSGTDCSEVTIELKDVSGGVAGTDVSTLGVVVQQSVLDPDTATIIVPAGTLANNKLYRLRASKIVRVEADETKVKAKRASVTISATVYLDTRAL